MTPVQKLVGLAVLILVAMATSFGVAWQVQDWRLGKVPEQGAQFETDLTAIGNAAAAQARAAQDKRLALEQSLATSEQKYTKELSDAQRMLNELSPSPMPVTKD